DEGGARIRFYINKLHEQTLHRERMSKELDQAIAEDQFFLVYQPKVDSSNGYIKGFEALIRWTHPQRGLISPVEFIPVLEESRKIIEVGFWVIDRTCAALKNWIDHGIEVVPVSVNVSMHQFKQAGFVEAVGAILKKREIPANLLEIEITESCLMDDGQESIEILKQLKEMGILISIDDFGTGYSSLSYLKRFPIDTLKIDRSFITNVHNRRDNDNAGIVTAIMALSHSLRLNVVAEGVEQPHELAFLHALGCRTIQGFLFSRPLEEDKVERLLLESLGMEETLENIKEALQASTD
ncbi:MAG: EAL domain-containing protein, partial [Gammaproteobacteria bacterium]|nr:EAL domain-containing protein [Gammaproteobacteria bacterium]